MQPQLNRGVDPLDTSRWQVAARKPGDDRFPPFENQGQPKCFFCSSDRLAVPRVYDTEDFYVIQATMMLPTLLSYVVTMILNLLVPSFLRKKTKPRTRMLLIPWAYLVIPKMHCVTVDDLPDYWSLCEREAIAYLSSIGFTTDNLSYNFTHAGGKRLAHLHGWLIQRPDKTCFGLATLIVWLRRINLRLAA